MTMAIATLVSRAEYDARTAAGERLEYDDGVVLAMPNNDSIHDGTKGDFNWSLVRSLQDPARVFVETAFEVEPDRVRHPDLAVLLTPRPRESGVKFKGAPDLAIEIVSESDTAEELANRVDLFLRNGATAVWVVWPRRRVIDVHQSGEPTRHYGAGSVLTGEEPIPAYRLDVGALLPGVR